MIVTKLDKNARIVFDPRTGMKLRYADGDYLKSTTPELVDVKITDFCPYKCSFCYQASLPEGKHGSTSYIKRVIDVLSSMSVFEIAYGGGEPSDHPDFAEIIQHTAERGIVPNFTAFGVKWMRDERVIEAVRRYVGGIGVSVHNVAHIAKVDKAVDATAGSNVKVMAQHVFGTLPFEDTMKIVDRSPHVLMLGYKTVGFGSSFQPFEFSNGQVRELIKASKKLSVDTAFVDRYSEAMFECGINPILTASPEGKFSCYVDAVEQKMAPSSYVEKQTMVPLKGNMDEMTQRLHSEYAFW
jgi:hypothetical protein